MRNSWSFAAVGIGMGVLWLNSPSHAQNAQFQSFFAAVCPTATGSLLSRCQQTPGGLGDLSSDSESSLNPNQLVALNDAALTRAQSKAREVEERLDSQRDGEPAEESAAGWSVFAQARGHFLDREAEGGQRGFEADSYGFHFGADRRVGANGVAGVLFAYDRTDGEFDADAVGVNFLPPRNDGETKVNAYSATAYASLQLSDTVWTEGSIGYGHTDYSLTRRAVFQEATRTIPQTNVSARADTDGHELTAGAALGFDRAIDAAELGAYARANFARSTVSGYRESDGSGLALRVASEDLNSLTSVLGVRGSYSISLGFGVLVPQLRFEWEHEFLNDAQSYASSFVEDGSSQIFTVRSASPDRNTFNGAAALVAILPNGWMPYAEYEGLIGHAYRSQHRVLLGLRKEL